MFAGKNLLMATKKASRADLIKKRPDVCVINKCVHGHKTKNNFIMV